MLNTLGVVAYSRVRQVKARLGPSIQSELRVAPSPSRAMARPDAKLQAPASITSVSLSEPVAVASRAAVRLPAASRAPSVRSELVLPSAEIERFLESRMYSHFCLLLAQGIAIPVVENAVLSDTALHFELPPNAPLKLGSMALLRSAWRAKRQAWLAIRLWRKQQR